MDWLPGGDLQAEVAIYGAALATLTAIAQGWRALARRRPKLHVESRIEPHLSPWTNNQAELRITAANDGSSIVQVIAVTFELRPRRWAAITTWSSHCDSMWLNQESLRVPVVINPQQHSEWLVSLAWPPFRIEAIDAILPSRWIRVRIHLGSGVSTSGKWEDTKGVRQLPQLTDFYTFSRMLADNDIRDSQAIVNSWDS